MSERQARRAPVLAVGAVLVLVTAVVASPGRGGAGLPGTGLYSFPSAAASTSAVAISSSWSCAGATVGVGSALAGQLVVDNAGRSPVRASVEMVTSGGDYQVADITVPAGGATPWSESVKGAAPGQWVGAMVTVYGGLASVSQVVSSRWGQAMEPCVSAPSGSWYFPYGFDLRNAGEYLSLLNPYPVDAIVDLSFTTELGREQPGDFQGVVVPADGLTVLGLPTQLRPRTSIATTVQVRAGEIVAFETELISKAPKNAPLVGAPGALNPVAPDAGVTLSAGAPAAADSLWWPSGGDGGGTTESYDIYNPWPQPARATLSLLTQGTTTGASAGVGGSDQVELPAYGSVQVRTNKQPWAISGTSYDVHLEGLDGARLVAERSTVTAPPSPQRGVTAMLGQPGAARQWVVDEPSAGSVPPGANFKVQLVNPGRETASVKLEMRTAAGVLAPVMGVSRLSLPAGQRASLPVSPARDGVALVLASTEPVVAEQDVEPTSARGGAGPEPAVVVAGLISP